MNSTQDATAEKNDQKVICPNCHNELNTLVKDNIFFQYFKCSNCEKTYRQRKPLDKDEAIFLIGEHLVKVKATLNYIVCILILWFLTFIVLMLYFLL